MVVIVLLLFVVAKGGGLSILVFLIYSYVMFNIERNSFFFFFSDVRGVEVFLYFYLIGGNFCMLIVDSLVVSFLLGFCSIKESSFIKNLIFWVGSRIKINFYLDSFYIGYEKFR